MSSASRNLLLQKSVSVDVGFDDPPSIVSTSVLAVVSINITINEKTYLLTETFDRGSLVLY